MAHGGCGEGVNTPGCEPGMRQFNSGQPPHSLKTRGIRVNSRIFSLFGAPDKKLDHLNG